MKCYRDYGWVLLLSSLAGACTNSSAGNLIEATGGAATGGLAPGAGGLATGGLATATGVGGAGTGGLTGTGGIVVAAGGAPGSTVGDAGQALPYGGSSGGASVGAGGVAIGAGGVSLGIDGGAYGGSSGGSPRGCDADLSGTWDLVATSSAGSTRSGVMIIGPDTFSVSVTTSRWWASTPSTKQLAYSAVGGKTLTWSRTDDPVIPIAVENVPAPLDSGSIPLGLGGQWSFAVNRMRCSAQIDTTSVIACEADPAAAVAGGTWPGLIPSPSAGVTYTVTRTSPLASQFGFLGGQWQARSNNSSKSCTMKAEGGTVNLSCRTGNGWDGLMQITVGSGCVASGSTSTGWELSARRR